ncbi:MAG TPA: hypothetical protein VMH92_08115 [Acidocella sp.]|nr:hypothetical protein [Acidocella sp.]
MQDDLNMHPRLPALLRGKTAQVYSNSLSHPPSSAPAGPKRDKFIGFVRDEESASLLHSVLAGHVPNSNQVHLVDFRHALTILQAMPTPEIVLVDLSGEEQPINALIDLADTVDAGTVVLAVGEVQNVNFYRIVVKTMGVKEYLPKPLTREGIARNFLPVIDNLVRETGHLRGGRMIALCGARGGVGTSCITANLGWYIANELRRHTVLLDGEINTGTLALDMDIPNGRGLTAVLEAPHRVDQLLLERCAHDAGERLHVIAGLEALNWEAPCDPEGIASFVQAVRARYNVMVVDAGARLTKLARLLLLNAPQRVIVLDPTMISLRNVEKLRSLPGGAGQTPHAVLVLNKAGAPGGLSRDFIEDRLGTALDAVIPDLPRVVGQACGLGTLAARQNGAFRNGIAALAQALAIGAQSATAPAETQPSYAGSR